MGPAQKCSILGQEAVLWKSVATNFHERLNLYNEATPLENPNTFPKIFVS
jgi:hypothetical protein